MSKFEYFFKGTGPTFNMGFVVQIWPEPK